MVKVNKSIIGLMLLLGISNYPLAETKDIAPINKANPTVNDIPDIVDRLLPGVVRIMATKKVLEAKKIDPAAKSLEEQLRKHFNLPDIFDNAKPKAKKGPAVGSGFVVESSDKEAFIVTNFHVLENAEKVEVVTDAEGNVKLLAKVVFKDKRTDLALLKVETKKKLPSLPLADSDKCRVGEQVISMGSPFGFHGTVTAGIISRKPSDLDLKNSGDIGDFLSEFIQTDAAVNVGNSGGPLVNLRGEVVGVSTVIFAPTGVSNGVAFAIPSNIVRDAIDQYKKYGRTKRGWLGVTVLNHMDDDLKEALGINERKGAVIASIVKNGPAEGKIKEGDLLIKVNNKEIKDARHLRTVVAELSDKVVPIELYRDGKLIEVKVLIGELEKAEESGIVASTNDHVSDSLLGELGLSVRALSNKTRQEYDVKGDVEGVVIVSISEDGIAAEKDLRPGDVITKVNFEAVTSEAKFVSIIKDAQKKGRKAISLMVVRNEDTALVSLPLDKKGKKV